MRGTKGAVDWPAVIQRAQQNPGEWLLAGSHVPVSALDTVRNRRNLTLRALDVPLEARMPTRVGSPPRGDLFVRYTGSTPPAPSESYYRTLILPKGLKERVIAYAAQQGVTAAAIVERALVRIARRGSDALPPDENVVLGINIRGKLWEKALARADRDGFVLADALRSELLRDVRRKKREPGE